MLRRFLSQSARLSGRSLYQHKQDGEIYRLLKDHFKGFDKSLSRRDISATLSKLQSQREIAIKSETLGFHNFILVAESLVRKGVFQVDYERCKTLGDALEAVGKDGSGDGLKAESGDLNQKQNGDRSQAQNSEQSSKGFQGHGHAETGNAIDSSGASQIEDTPDSGETTASSGAFKSKDTWEPVKLPDLREHDMLPETGMPVIQDQSTETPVPSQVLPQNTLTPTSQESTEHNMPRERGMSVDGALVEKAPVEDALAHEAPAQEAPAQESSAQCDAEIIESENRESETELTGSEVTVKAAEERLTALRRAQEAQKGKSQRKKIRAEIKVHRKALREAKKEAAAEALGLEKMGQTVINTEVTDLGAAPSSEPMTVETVPLLEDATGVSSENESPQSQPDPSISTDVLEAQSVSSPDDTSDTLSSNQYLNAQKAEVVDKSPEESSKAHVARGYGVRWPPRDDIPEEILQYTTMDVPQTRPYYLPFSTQYKVIVQLQGLLEEACFKYVQREHPKVLTSFRWEVECPEALELHQYVQILKDRAKYKNQDMKTLNQHVSMLYNSLVDLRHAAVHRNRTMIQGIETWAEDAASLATLLRDPDLREKFLRIKNELAIARQRLVENRLLLENTLLTSVKDLAAKREELLRLEKVAIDSMAQDTKDFKISTATSLEKGLEASLSQLTPPSEAPKESAAPRGLLAWIKSWFDARF